MENTKYLLVFKDAGIDMSEGSRICDILSKETKERLTRPGFDRRLIKPLLSKAAEKNNGKISDDAANELLDDINFITKLMSKIK